MITFTLPLYKRRPPAICTGRRGLDIIFLAVHVRFDSVTTVDTVLVVVWSVREERARASLKFALAVVQRSDENIDLAINDLHFRLSQSKNVKLR